MAIVAHFNRAPKKRGLALTHGGDAQAYQVTAKTTVPVGRKRFKPDAVVWLTPLQAAYELNLGNIALMNPQPASGAKTAPAKATAPVATTATTAPAAASTPTASTPV